MVDGFATADTSKNTWFLVGLGRGNQGRDRLADYFGGFVSKQFFRARIPRRDNAIQIFCDNRIVGRFENRTQQYLWVKLRLFPIPPKNVYGAEKATRLIHNRRNAQIILSELTVFPEALCLPIGNELAACNSVQHWSFFIETISGS